jgi:hypothetical protein
MSDFVITHRAGQQAEADPSCDLAGAVLTYPKRPNDDPDGPPFYRLISLAEMDRHIELGDEIIYGTEQETIEAELLRRHPAPAGTSYLLFQEGYATPREQDQIERGTSYRRRRRGWNHPPDPNALPDGWLLLPRPYVDARDLDVIRDYVNTLGPVYIPALSEGEFRRWREEGFVTSPRHPSLWQANYSPRSISAKEFRERQKHYDERMKGYFPCPEMNAIFTAVADIPDSKYSKQVKLQHSGRSWDDKPHPNRYGGKTSDDRVHCIDRCAKRAQDILEAERTVKRLCPGETGWYLTKSETGYSENSSLAKVISSLLPWFHGVEALASRPHDERYVSGIWLGDDDAKSLRDFCKWLRLQMRRLKIKLPPKPQPPVKPSAKKPSTAKRRTGASKGSGAKARRSRTKSAAPA